MFFERIGRHVSALSRVDIAHVRALDLHSVVADAHAKIADGLTSENDDARRQRSMSFLSKDVAKWGHEGRLFDFGVRLLDAIQKANLCNETNLVQTARYILARRIENSWASVSDDASNHARPQTLSTGKLAVLIELTSNVWLIDLLEGRPQAVNDPATYSQSIGLTGPLGVTASGRVFLELPSRKAVTWLLALEMAGSLGNRDRSRVSRATLVDILARPSASFLDCGEAEHESPFDWDVALRLETFGICTTFTEHDDESPYDQYGYSLVPEGEAILRELVVPPVGPMVSLAESLLSDNAAAAMSKAGPAGVDSALRSIQGDIARQTALMKHELRNKLTPAANQLDAVIRNEPAWSDWDRDSIQIAAQAVADALTYVDKMVTYTNALTADAAWFPAAGAVRDGVRQGRNGNRTATIALIDTLDEWDLHGLREELVLVVANLVRNALQAGASRIEIQVDTGNVAGAGLTLNVHDNGPGVPIADRKRIFDRGYSGRQSSGDGLWLARDTVERQFGGTLTYEDRQTGGATFVIALPASKTRRSTDQAETP